MSYSFFNGVPAQKACSPGGATSNSVLWLGQPCVRHLVVAYGDASILGITAEVTTECYVLIEAVIPLHWETAIAWSYGHTQYKRFVTFVNVMCDLCGGQAYLPQVKTPSQKAPDQTPLPLTHQLLQLISDATWQCNLVFRGQYNSFSRSEFTVDYAIDVRGLNAASGGSRNFCLGGPVRILGRP